MAKTVLATTKAEGAWRRMLASRMPAWLGLRHVQQQQKRKPEIYLASALAWVVGARRLVAAVVVVLIEVMVRSPLRNPSPRPSSAQAFSQARRTC